MSVSSSLEEGGTWAASPALRSAVAACPHALARGDAPNLAPNLLGEPQVAIRAARDALRPATGRGDTAAAGDEAATGGDVPDGGEKGGQARPQTRTLHASSSFSLFPRSSACGKTDGEMFHKLLLALSHARYLQTFRLCISIRRGVTPGRVAQGPSSFDVLVKYS